LFGRQAETAAQYLKKGRPVMVEGRMQTRSWDGKDGEKKYRTEIVADRFQFGPSAPGSQGSGSYQKSSGPKTEPSHEEKGSPAPMDTIEYPEEDIKPEDIPF
jgi:single-strand DNA-binding protein